MSNLTARKVLEILKIAEVVICKEFRSNDEVKIVFSDNPSQNMLTPIYEVK